MIYADLKQEVSDLLSQIAQKKQELTNLLAHCTHDELESKTRYHQGGYYDRAYTEHWSECVLCGNRVGETREHHSWYG